jgi:hypothetical protein
MEIDQPQGVEADPLERMMQYVEAGEEEVPEEVEQSAAESEEPDEAAEETTGEPEAEEATEVITHNGEEKTVTKAELKELAQQGFDYTQKTQQLAETRRYLESQELAIQQQAQFQAQFTEQLVQVKAAEAQLAQWKQVNWTELAQTDPMQYLSLHHQYQEAKEAHQAQLQNLNQAHQQATQARTQQQAQRLAQEAQAMRQAIPEWKDQARATAEMGEIRNLLVGEGFAEQEISTIADHRQVKLLRELMTLRKAVSAGTKKVAATPPTAKPGAKQQNTTSAKDQDLRQRLRKTGDSTAAAKLIERML